MAEFTRAVTEMEREAAALGRVPDWGSLEVEVDVSFYNRYTHDNVVSVVWLYAKAGKATS